MTAGRSLPIVGLLITLGLQAPDSSPLYLSHVRLHAQEQLPPVSYICPMDPDVVDVAPGRCPLCKMILEPVRLDLAWSCPNHAAVIAGKPGACPIDRRELVQVTVAKYWTCSESGKQHLLEPGACGNRKPRKLEQAIRAHGDHNPRHGGQFFMAADKWHHLEGTYPSADLFRVHFYDNFTKVYPAKGFSGRLVIREENNRELESVPLRIARNGVTMEADLRSIGAPTKDSPLKLAVKLTFKPGEPEQRFDFTFTEITKEPVTIAPNAPIGSNAESVRAPATKPSGSSAARSEAASPTYTRPAVPVVAETAPASTTAAPASDDPLNGPPLLSDCRPTMSRNDAVAFGQRLPRASGELLRLLALCSAEVDTLIKEGQFGLVYQPSILSKDIAIALEDTTAELPNGQRAPASDAIRRVVLAAWMLDLYGDQGNREKLTESYNTFAAAVADIKTAYGTKP